MTGRGEGRAESMLIVECERIIFVEALNNEDQFITTECSRYKKWKTNFISKLLQEFKLIIKTVVICFNIKAFCFMILESIFGFRRDLRKKQRLFPYTTSTDGSL
jgi:hypothetical protein